MRIQNPNIEQMSLEIIMGCRFSGKSTELIRRVRRYQELVGVGASGKYVAVCRKCYSVIIYKMFLPAISTDPTTNIVSKNE